MRLWLDSDRLLTARVRRLVNDLDFALDDKLSGDARQRVKTAIWCESYLADAVGTAAMLEGGSGRYVIRLDISDSLSDDAVRYLIAHEVAHVAADHPRLAAAVARLDTEAGIAAYKAHEVDATHTAFNLWGFTVSGEDWRRAGFAAPWPGGDQWQREARTAVERAHRLLQGVQPSQGRATAPVAGPSDKGVPWSLGAARAQVGDHVHAIKIASASRQVLALDAAGNVLRTWSIREK